MAYVAAVAKGGSHAFLREVVLAVLGALTIGVAAQAAIPLPWTPVPISLQTLALSLIGATMGSRRGVMTVLTYLLMGCMGLPVFAKGACGAAHLIGPTGGYLIGYIGTAWLTGFLVERGLSDRPWKVLIAMIAGQTLLFSLGLLWLAQFIGADRVLMAGLIPFLPGDAIKLSIAAMCLPGARKVVNKLLTL